MAKIGSSTSLNQPKGDSTWAKFSLALVDPNSDSWFEALGPVSVSDHFGPEFLKKLNQYSLISHVAREDLKIIPKLEISSQDQGEIQEIPESALGRVILSFLKASEISMSYKTMWPVSHESMVELDTKVRLEGQWGTESGTPFIESLEIYKDSSGKTSAYWFTDLLASPISIESYNFVEFVAENGGVESFSFSDEGLGWSVGQVLTKLQLPNFLKKLAFFCETPFPSTQIMTLSRSLAFSDVPEDAWPQPYFKIQKNGLAQGFSRTLSEVQGGVKFDGCLAPVSVQFGWRFGEEAIPYLATIMPVAVDGLALAMSVVEDGFENYRAIDYGYPWDLAVGSPCAYLVGYEEGHGNRGGAPQWTPNTHIGELVTSTEVAYRAYFDERDKGQLDQAREILEGIVSWGAGPYLAHGINTYLYSFKLKDLKTTTDELWYAELLAQQVIEMDMEGQSTNALSNLGIAYFVAGELEKAEKTFESALQRKDKFAEAEASYFLSLIEETRGNSDAASKHSQRCQQAGGYEPPTWLVSTESQLTASKLSSESSASVAKFCHNCGGQFKAPEEKFCTSCGTKRT